jgi:site-specific recombinase XerD
MTKRMVKNVAEINRGYLVAYEKSFTNNASWLQYKVDCTSFLTAIGERDLVKIKWEDVEKYLLSIQGEETTKKNKISHIKGLLKFVVRENLGNARFHINKSILFELL